MSFSIEYKEYADRILGSWLGKSIGGTIGAPLKNHKIEMHFTPDNCWPDEAAPNVDVDIQVVWLEALEEYGPWLDARILAQYWQDRCWHNFGGYGVFLHNIQRGISPPASGWFNNRFFGESMGCPIRSEIWGLVCPGNPDLAAAYAREDGQLDHGADSVSVHAEQYLAAAVSWAFTACDVAECLDAAMSAIPRDSKLAAASRFTQTLCVVEPDWRKIRKILVRRYGHRDSSRTLINQVLIQMALRKGNGNFTDSLMIALNSGWDTDCTAASVGGLLGAFLGAGDIPGMWKKRIGKKLKCGVEVRHKNTSFDKLADETARVGVEVSLAHHSPIIFLDGPEVEMRLPGTDPLDIHFEYPGLPVLTTEKETAVLVVMRNESHETHRGVIDIIAPEGVRVSCLQATLEIGPQETELIPINIRVAPGVSCLWDKNLFEVTWREHDLELRESFGLAGARQWVIYGPYWDIYDTTEHDECPFHNDTVKANPCLIPGSGRSAYHQYANLDRIYLDEIELLKGALPEESPFVVETGEDCLDERNLGGFTGEACYYLVRTIHADEEKNLNFMAGATCPFVMWLNGDEVMRNDKVTSWCPHDFSAEVKLNKGENRLVVKVARNLDTFRFSLLPMRPDFAEDKSQGVSMIDDSLGCEIAPA